MEITASKDKEMKSVYTVADRDGRSYWTKIGVGFTNRDGSLTLKLDALPTNATLQVREYESAEQRAEALRRRFGNAPAAA